MGGRVLKLPKVPLSVVAMADLVGKGCRSEVLDPGFCFSLSFGWVSPALGLTRVRLVSIPSVTEFTQVRGGSTSWLPWPAALQ